MAGFWEGNPLGRSCWDDCGFGSQWGVAAAALLAGARAGWASGLLFGKAPGSEREAAGNPSCFLERNRGRPADGSSGQKEGLRESWGLGCSCSDRLGDCLRFRTRCHRFGSGLNACGGRQAQRLRIPVGLSGLRWHPGLKSGRPCRRGTAGLGPPLLPSDTPVITPIRSLERPPSLPESSLLSPPEEACTVKRREGGGGDAPTQLPASYLVFQVWFAKQVEAPGGFQQPLPPSPSALG